MAKSGPSMGWDIDGLPMIEDGRQIIS